MKKLIKKIPKNKTILLDEFTFLSPACVWVNKLSKNKIKVN